MFIVRVASCCLQDEPTSGLDASAALKVMRYMRVLALSGRTVLLTIHQPRAAIWEHIDKVSWQECVRASPDDPRSYSY